MCQDTDTVLSRLLKQKSLKLKLTFFSELPKIFSEHEPTELIKMEMFWFNSRYCSYFQ